MAGEFFLSEAFASIKAVADPRQFRDAASKAIKGGLAGLDPTVQVQLGSEKARADAKVLQARLKETFKGLSESLDLNDKKAQLAFARMAASADVLHRKLANEKITLEGVAKAELQLLGLEVQVDRLKKKFSGLSVGALGKSLNSALPGFANLATAGIALGPALLPVFAAATAGAVGLSAAVIGGGAAFGIFGIAAKGNLTELQKELTKVQAANKSAALAEQTAASKRTAAQKQAIVNARQLTAAFQKEFGAEAGAIEKLKSAWTSFTTQPVVANAIAAGARLLTAVLPHLLPLLRLGAAAVQAFEGALAGFVVGGGLDKLIAGLVKIGRISLAGFLAVLHNLAVAFGALSGGASAFAAGAVAGLVKLSAAFASWAQNKGPAALTGLMNVVRRLGPAVVTLIKSLAAAVPNLAAGLTPLAPLSLALATSLAKLVKNVPPQVITAIALAFAGWTVAAKGLMAAGALGDAWKAVAKFAAVTEGATVAETIAAAATRAWGLAMDALPFVAIAAAAAALVYLIIKYHKQIWAFVVKVWHDIWGFIKKTWDDIWGFAKQWWPLIFGAAGLIIKYHNQIWAFIQRIWGDIFSFIKRIWNDIWSTAKTLMGNFWATFRDGWVRIWNTAKTVWGNIIDWVKKLPGRVVGALWGLGHSLSAFMHSAFTDMWNAAKNVAKSIWNWLTGWVQRLPSWLRKILHISSPSGVFYSIGRNMMLGLEKGIRHGAQAAERAAKKALGFFGGHGGDLGGDPAANRLMAMRMFPWPKSSQWGAFEQLEMAEAGFNRFARNPFSGAYGIPQALPPTKMPFSAQAGGGSHAGSQLAWMFSYISGRYGDPLRAWAHEQAFHWYGAGGLIPEPVLGVGASGRMYGFAESGPEWIVPAPLRRPAGAAAQAAPDTGQRVQVDITLTGGDAEFRRWLRKNIRVNGGDPAVLGR
jgi:phage-related protein